LPANLVFPVGLFWFLNIFVQNYTYFMHKLILFFLFLSLQVNGQRLEELFLQAKVKNEALVNTSYQRELASLARKVADWNRFNPRAPLSYQALDNISLQKMLVPGVLFGLPEGTYKEMVMGQKYSATLSVSPQFDLLNFSAVAQKKSAEQNEVLVHLQSKLQEREIYTQLNTAYHNVLSYQGQITLLEKNLETALRILAVVNDRVEEGLLRTQDRNEAEINVLTVQENIEQMKSQMELQLALLRLLSRSDGPVHVMDEGDFGAAKLALLDQELAEVKAAMARADMEVARREQWPVLSAISSFNWQNLSNDFFYASGSRPIYYAYLGLKLTWDLPSTPQKLSNYKNKQIQWKIAENGAKDRAAQAAFDHMSRLSDQERAKKRRENLAKIEGLKKDSFEKNLARFEENILPLDELLKAQNEWLQSQINRYKEEVNEKYTSYTIKIYNDY
jgi:outer membrane protein TolC